MSYAAERRRAHRVTVDGASELIVPTTWPIQVQDVSLGGASFHSTYRLELGRRVQVFGTLAGEPFRASVQVCWTHARRDRVSGRPGYEVGAAFVDFAGGSRNALEQFLKRSARP
jgi:hypothetical protein